MSAELDVLVEEQQKLQELLAQKQAEKQRMLDERAAQQEVRSRGDYRNGTIVQQLCTFE